MGKGLLLSSHICVYTYVYMYICIYVVVHISNVDLVVYLRGVYSTCFYSTNVVQAHTDMAFSGLISAHVWKKYQYVW